MKKKLGDITFAEYVKECQKNEYCRVCSLRDYCPVKRYDTPACMANELDKEVEL